MHHFTLDAFRGFRSRLDDIHLVHEVLDEIPLRLGLKALMPPFVLPYYNGVIPEDCGISAFVFLAGGHFTIHTFSFRESYFVDVVHPEPFDPKRLESMIQEVFPAERRTRHLALRGGRVRAFPRSGIDERNDFGPHLMLDFARLRTIPTLDSLVGLFDHLPHKIGMTPIMRPYAVRTDVAGESVVSIMTMIAESHISLHVFPKQKRAYLDLFSCTFFETDGVVEELRNSIDGSLAAIQLVSRGHQYKKLRTNTDQKTTESRAWLENVFPPKRAKKEKKS
jgi:S-adenosylmethionine/arginine decarboxylase-like enzyme